MIKGINTGGRYLQVQGGSPMSTYVNNSMGMGVGNMRYNTTNQNIEIYDGNNWQQMNMQYATVDLTYEAQSLLDWAQRERARQNERERLILNNPALQKAYEAIKRAEENFDILHKFVEHDQDDGVLAESAA